MVNEYEKGSDLWLSENFHLREFDCHCTDTECTTTLVDSDLIQSLEVLRLTAGALRINRGYSCAKHNTAIGGREKGYHPKGKAADIVSKKTPKETAKDADSIPAFKNGGIGTYGNFTHVDVRGFRARWNG